MQKLKNIKKRWLKIVNQKVILFGILNQCQVMKKLTLMELTERTCKWPIGDPATEDFWFCGLPSVAGKPYCEAHVGVAFQPMSARRDRRR
jgi:hypothetical protein